LGFVSWLSECVAFYLVLLGFGLEGGGLLLLKATFILATSSLGGSILLIPGGLGVAEGGITGLSQVLLAMPKAPAAAAALIIRFCTLWFGVTLGMVMLFFTLRRLAASDEAIVAEGSTYGLERTATND
ncbi:MAG: flippase-like domain-containing protein, partial [Chloroflexi bacterium]|nr:flippase-like domain-containing protein [Chloroflexota bacterium]